MDTQKDTPELARKQVDGPAARAMRLAIQKAEPKNRLIMALYGFGSECSDGVVLRLTGEITREQVRRSLDRDGDLPPVATDRWMDSLESELAQAIAPIIEARVQQLEQAIVADLNECKAQVMGGEGGAA
jgi:hypothetical protein